MCAKKRYIFENRAKDKQSFGQGSWRISDPSLFEDEEGTFIDNNKRRRVYVHLVPAPWSRVLAYSLIYALAVTFAQEIWFWAFGRPQWHITSPRTEQSAPVDPAQAIK